MWNVMSVHHRVSTLTVNKQQAMNTKQGGGRKSLSLGNIGMICRVRLLSAADSSTVSGTPTALPRCHNNLYLHGYGSV